MKTYMLDLNSIDRVKGFVSAIENSTVTLT